MKITEKKAQGIRECTRVMRKALREHYDDYDAAVCQMKGCIRGLKQHYDDETIKMAFDVVSREMLESRKTSSERRVTEMGRLSTSHDANKDRIASAKAHSANCRANTPKARLLRYTSDIVGTLQQFCKELNEDSYIKLGVFDSSKAALENKHLAAEGLTTWIGICPLDDPSMSPDSVTDDEKFCSEFNFNIYLQAPTTESEKVGPNSDCEMENYGPCMRHQMDWYKVIDAIKAGTFTTDTLWGIVEKDPVFVNFLITGDEDSVYNEETGEYDEDQEQLQMRKTIYSSDKKSLKEDRYASVEDEINDIENGGYEAFEADDDLVNPYLASANHKEALAHGRSDLDQANFDERVTNIEDDLAYEVESNEYPEQTIDEITNKDPEDSYRWYVDQADENGMIHGIDIANNEDVMEEIASSYVDYVADNLPVEGSSWPANPVRVISNTLAVLAKYANNDYPSCKAYFEGLSAYANKFNALLQKLACNYPTLIIIPAANGVVNESKKTKESKGMIRKRVKESFETTGIACVYMNEYFSDTALRSIAEYVDSYVGTDRIKADVVAGANGSYILFQAQNEAQVEDIMHLCMFPDEYDIKEMGVAGDRFSRGIFEVIGSNCQKMALL